MTQLPDDLKMRRAKKIVDAGALSTNSIPLAMLTEGIITNDKLDALTEAIKSIPETIIPETIIPETDLSATNELLKQLIDKEDKPLDIKVSLKLV